MSIAIEREDDALYHFFRRYICNFYCPLKQTNSQIQLQKGLNPIFYIGWEESPPAFRMSIKLSAKMMHSINFVGTMIIIVKRTKRIRVTSLEQLSVAEFSGE